MGIKTVFGKQSTSDKVGDYFSSKPESCVRVG